MKNLTEREKEVVGLVVTGLTNAEVAERLSIKMGTVRIHLHHVFVKLNVRNRTELATMQLREEIES